MPEDPDQLARDHVRDLARARDRERLAELEVRWSPSILDLTYDDAMGGGRTGMEIQHLRRRIEAAEKEEGKR